MKKHRPKHSSKTHKKNSKLRIIGGNFRGRTLPVIDADGLRPTTDRIRETVFNWLHYDIAGKTCLDAFSGTGALGFEALSRGAKSVTFCEVDKRAQHQLAENIDLLKLDNASLCRADGLSELAKGAFDGIFLDPPYTLNLLPEAIEIIRTLSPQPDWIYLEHNSPLADIVTPLTRDDTYELHREKRAGQVYYGLLRRKNNTSQ